MLGNVPQVGMQIKLLLDENHWFPGYHHFHWKSGLRADFVHLFCFNASTIPYTTLFYSVLSYHGIYYIHYTTSALHCSILSYLIQYLACSMCSTYKFCFTYSIRFPHLQNGNTCFFPRNVNIV